MIHLVINPAGNSNSKWWGYRKLWSWTCHPYRLQFHPGYRLAIGTGSQCCLCHDWNILCRIIQIMSWSWVWNCELFQTVWRVSCLSGQELGRASLWHGELWSTKILVQLAFLWCMLSLFVSEYAMCVLLIHSDIDVRREMRWCLIRLKLSSVGHFHLLICCQSRSGTVGVSTKRLILNFIVGKWCIYMIETTSRTSSSIFWLHQLKVGRADAPPKAKQSPKTMSICTLSRYWRCLLIVFPLGGLPIVSKEPIVYRRRPKLTRILFVAAVTCFDCGIAYNLRSCGDLVINTVSYSHMVLVLMKGG